VLWDPNLTVIDGQEGSFEAGGEYPVAGSADGMFAGLSVHARVQTLEDGKMRVWLRLLNGAASKADASQVIVRESVVRSVHTIRADQSIELQFDNTTTVRVAVQPLERK
jgi:hypothetical protein